MKFLLLLNVALATVSLILASESPLSNEFIEKINSHKSSWQAGHNFDVNTPIAQIRSMLGVRSDNHLHRPTNYVVHGKKDIPESFDARKNWPECSIIGQIRDQSNCGSCWAFGAAEAMSDRICIHSNGTKKISISAEDIVGCCESCGYGCSGGWLLPTWEFWQETGIVSGGLYNDSAAGCKQYSFAPCEHHSEGDRPECADIPEHDSECVKKCDDPSVNYEKSKTYGQKPYGVLTEEQIQLEIMTNGPVEASFDVYYDFLTYKSGVYKHLEGDYAGGHAIKILGWGVENGEKYWLMANSWNNDWGDNGYFKFLRGENHCGMESDIVAALPKLD